MSDIAVTSEIEMLACKLRGVHDNPEYAPPAYPVGFFGSGDEYCIQLRFGSVNVITGRTEYKSIATIYADACQYHFAPWMRRNRHKLAAYNYGPGIAADFLARNKPVRELLIDIENQLVAQGTIRPRVEKEAGLNAKYSDEAIQKLIERITALETLVAKLERAANYVDVPAPLPVHTFRPPGSMAHPPVNFVHHESVNPAIAKSVFKL